MSVKLKEIILSDVHALIKHLSGFEDDESNFKACEKFILSHLLHHRYLSTDSHAVRRSLDGIALKFEVKGLPDKAQAFKEHVQDFIRLYDVKDGGTADIQWCLLSLLLNLANSPANTTNDEVQSETRPSQTVDADVIDWRSYLLEGSEDYQRDWNELSDVDDDNDIEDESPATSVSETVTPPCSVQVAQAPSTAHEDVAQKKCMNIVNQIFTSETWLKANIQHTWWTQEKTQYKPPSNHPAAGSILDKPNGENSENSISEHDVLLEILWMLSSPSVTFVFMQTISDDGITREFCVRPNVTIPSLCHDVFASLLSPIAQCSTIIHELKDFSTKLYNCKCQAEVPLTYQAYNAAIHKELEPLFETISELEPQIHKQDKTFTILGLLEQLRPWLSKLQDLYHLHVGAVLDWKKYPNWLCSIHLLSVLFSQLNKAKNATTVLRIFLKTFKVYLDILGNWHAEGQLNDWRDEFLVSRCVSTSDLLGAVFEKHNWESEITALGVECPKVLILLADCALREAQPLHVLQHLNRLPELQKQNFSKRNLYVWFLNHVLLTLENYEPHIEKQPEQPKNNNTPWWKHIDRYLPDPAEEPKKIPEQRNEFSVGHASFGMVMDHLARIDDPLLHENFSYLLNASITSDSTSGIPHPEISLENSTLEKFMNFTKNMSELTPLQWPIEHAVQSLPTVWGGIASSMVAAILMSEQQLLTHMQNAQSVFMMLSLHKLQPFISHLFKLILHKEDLLWMDASSLSVLLQDCMDSDNLSISVTEDDKSLHNISVLECFDCLSVKYQVEWPLCAILRDKSETMYNTIFNLLLKLRWGLWNLEHITMRGSTKLTSPLGGRLLLLRFQLLHILQSTYSFLCHHILSVLSSDFCESIKNANDLHKIIDVHNRFLSNVVSKCLQSDEADPVKTALYQLVVLAENVRLLWSKDQLSINPRKVANMEACYSDCRKFLGLALRTRVEEEGQQHLEFLRDLINWNMSNDNT